MAQLTGYICDVCEAFSVDRNGWLRVTSAADKDSKGFDICSNRCLIKFGEARRREAGEAGEVGKYRGGGSNRTPTNIIDDAVTYSLDHTIQETADYYKVPVQKVHQWRHSRGVTNE